MDIKDYAKSLSQCVMELIDFDAQINVVTVVKNNGIERTALVIKEESTNISPTIYLDDYYEKYASESDFEQAAKHIISVYSRWKIEGDIDVDKYTQFEQVKDSIILKLVNKEQNKIRLALAPTMDFLDMTLCFYIRTSDERFGEGVILINNDLFNRWGISKAELYERAIANTARLLPEKQMSFVDVLAAHREEVFEDGAGLEEFYGDNGMFILTNSDESYGASVLVYSKLLKEISDKYEDDLVIIPSSVHEIIVVLRKCARAYLDDICELIDYVNSTCVAQEDVLANHAYYYCRENSEISICPRVYNCTN